MFIVLLKDAMLVRCHSRQQQLIVAFSMGVLTLGLLSFVGWSAYVAESARATLGQFDARDELGHYIHHRQRSDLYMVMGMWYAIAVVVLLPALIFAVAGAVNFVRWSTFTGVLDERRA